MPDYVFAYHGGRKPETAEEGQKEMEKWGAWFAHMGDAVVNPGNAVGQSWTVSSSGISHDGGANPLSGFTVVRADSMEAAAEMAKGCPILNGGSVEVAPVIEM
ncbi:YCII-related domain-containing protein [Hoeflea sp. IMCC20628]|uniref:YciI family protein n=1 Tax=Hoeflea sp. IMCC20628 TaxID=1620421 RepID=UPI00063AA2D1|nr:YciI family protein [Hoeflea sp. IMCC20628]AKI01165.1 YCII-related domain-containing protein [Hoeflea sp. IMCC20628]